MKWSLTAALLLSAPVRVVAGSAGEAKEVRALVETTVNSVLEVLKQKGVEREPRKRKIMTVARPVFDFNLMGKLTLGRAYWPKLSEPQRKEFTDLFVRTIEDSYYEKIDLFTNETVEFDEPTPGEKGKYQMLTWINSKGQRYKLLYKLYKKESSWKIYDLEIEGISIIRSYGSQYDQVLQKSSVGELLAKMREKTLEIPKELKEASKKGKAKTEKL